MANNANILLHGLFALQYQGGQLIAMTPGTMHHQFLMRQQGQAGSNLNPFPNLPQGMDFTNLTGKTVATPFPTTMPQFDKSVTGVGDLVVKPGMPKNYRCRIVFNLPLDLITLRTKNGQLKDYHMDPKSVVGQDILRRSGPGLGLITLLHYETSDPPFTLSLFAEHRIPPSPPSDMNPVLAATQSLFANGSNFDLQLVDTPAGVPPVCPDDTVPASAAGYGVLRDDEHSFGEVYDDQDCAEVAGSDVANCVQFGLLG